MIINSNNEFIGQSAIFTTWSKIFISFFWMRGRKYFRYDRMILLRIQTRNSMRRGGFTEWFALISTAQVIEMWMKIL